MRQFLSQNTSVFKRARPQVLAGALAALFLAGALPAASQFTAPGRAGGPKVGVPTVPTRPQTPPDIGRPDPIVADDDSCPVGTYMPGAQVRFYDLSPLTEGNWKQAQIYIQNVKGGTIWQLPAQEVEGLDVPLSRMNPDEAPPGWNPDTFELPPLGFEVPQLPKGVYSVWYELNGQIYGDAVSETKLDAARVTGRKMKLCLQPALNAIALGNQGEIGDTVQVQVEIVGPSEAPQEKGAASRPINAREAGQKAIGRQKLTDVQRSAATQGKIGRPTTGASSFFARSEKAGIVALAEGQSATIPFGDERSAIYQWEIKSAGSATLTFSAQGYQADSVTIEGLAPPPPTSAIPVVFVPGTAGSRLVLPDRRVLWLAQETLKDKAILPAGALNAQGTEAGKNDVRATGVLGGFTVNNGILQWMLNGPYVQHTDIYADFLAWARDVLRPPGGKSAAFYVAPYDWRQGASDESAAALDAVVKRALAETGQDQVILLAHSLGGLVSRDYVKRVHDGQFGANKTKVRSLIAVGTPWLGAPKTARALMWGYNFGVGEEEGGGIWLMPLDVKIGGEVEVNETTVLGKKMTLPFLASPVNLPGFYNYPDRLSLLDLGVSKDLSRNWPAVFQQLPVEDYMSLYGRAKGQNGQRSLIYGTTPAGVLDFYAGKNSTLFNAAQAWRQSVLTNNDFGTKHYLLAGTMHAEAPVADLTDMQMAQPEHVAPIAAIRPRMISKSRILFDSYQDHFFATDGGLNWGDGTSPLLSATAGAMLKKGGTLNLNETKNRLGNNVEVSVFDLGRIKDEKGDWHYWGHGSMLNDAQVRAKLLQVLRDENQAVGFTVPPAVDTGVVDTLKIELKTKDNDWPWDDYGTFNIVAAWFKGYPMAVNTTLGGLRTRLLNGSTSSFEFKHPKVMENGGWRRLRFSDLNGGRMRFSKESGDDWVCAGVRVFADGKQVLSDDRDFRLTGSNERWTNEMQLIP